tara:strand:- start:85 stop:516 length:432 start_codon:yes stop_codon:yes gene_type:complete
MEQWIMYGILAAFLIASRDFFTSKYTTKYTTTEHILYYYIFCAISISAYVCYRRINNNEKIKIIETEDLWKYILIATASVLVITPCEVMSIRSAKNPGKARALTSMNFVVLFFVSVYFMKSEKMTAKKLGGIILTILGIYMLV